MSVKRLTAELDLCLEGLAQMHKKDLQSTERFTQWNVIVMQLHKLDIKLSKLNADVGHETVQELVAKIKKGLPDFKEDIQQMVSIDSTESALALCKRMDELLNDLTVAPTPSLLCMLS